MNKRTKFSMSCAKRAILPLLLVFSVNTFAACLTLSPSERLENDSEPTSTEPYTDSEDTSTTTDSAGGPYSIAEGDSVTLDVSVSFAPDSGTRNVAWDLNNDSDYGDVTGEATTVDWGTLKSFGIDDDGPYPISVKVDDGHGGFTADSTLFVSNTPSMLSTTGENEIKVGEVCTLNLGAVDPGDDTIISWTINWGDGAIETVEGNPSSRTHTYNNLGFTNSILASAVDEDGTHLQNELVVASSGNDKLIWYDNTGQPRNPVHSGSSAG